MEFGDFIKAKRKEQMLSQRAMAAKLGISTVYVSYFESGKRNPPSKKLLVKLAQVLNLSSEDESMLFFLAVQKRYQNFGPGELADYISDHDYVKDVMGLACEYKVSEKDWDYFKNYILKKYR